MIAGNIVRLFCILHLFFTCSLIINFDIYWFYWQAKRYPFTREQWVKFCKNLLRFVLPFWKHALCTAMSSLSSSYSPDITLYGCKQQTNLFCFLTVIKAAEIISLFYWLMYSITLLIMIICFVKYAQWTLHCHYHPCLLTFFTLVFLSFPPFTCVSSWHIQRFHICIQVIYI